MLACLSDSFSPVDLDSILLNNELAFRPARKAAWRAERAALSTLNAALANGRTSTLKCLANLALRLCRAGTAGVSVLHRDVFHWQAVAGELENCEGGTSRREHSVCGACLDAGKPLLLSWPARRFAYLAEIDTPIVEGLVVPVHANGAAVATIWIASHDAEHPFDAEDLRILCSLAKFAGAAFQCAEHSTLAVIADMNCSDRNAIWAGYLCRIGRNDMAALTALFCEARALVFATALRIVTYPADAEEIAADVFTKIWSSGHTFEPSRGSATGWILAITRNLSFEMVRGRTQELHVERAECVDADAESCLSSTERNGNLHRAVASLPLPQREAIELAFFSGLSHAEIAQLLSERLGTIKTRIRLGLGRLRTTLE